MYIWRGKAVERTTYQTLVKLIDIDITMILDVVVCRCSIMFMYLQSLTVCDVNKITLSKLSLLSRQCFTNFYLIIILNLIF